MGKAKFVILAAIILLVQTGTGQGIIKVNDQVHIKHVLAADDCDWPMFGRTPDGNRVVPDGCGPKSNDLVLKWNFQTNDNIFCAPIVYEGYTYFGSYDKKVYCIEITTGKKRWEFETNANVTSTPVISDNKICFGSMDGCMYCCDLMSGILLWKYCTGIITASATIYNHMIYFGSWDKAMYCLSLENGSLIWKFATGNLIQSTPAILNNKLYFGSMDKHIYCLSADSGNQVWNFETNNYITSSPVYYNGRIYFGSLDAMFYCINADTGIKNWEFKTGDKVHSSPSVSANRVYFGSWDDSLYCLDTETGKQEWSFKTANYITSSPVIYSGKVYFGSLDKKIYCLDKISGKLIWSYNTNGEIRSTPVIANNVLLIGSADHNLYCFKDSHESIPSSVIISKQINSVDLCKYAIFSAQVFDQNNQEIKDAKVTWSVEPKDIGTIDEMGIFKPSKLGVATITCKCGDISAYVVVNVVDSLFVDTEGIRIDILKPFEKVSKKFTLTNNGDAAKDITLSSSIGTVAVNPSSLTLAAGESREIEVSSQINQIEPIPDTEFTITITNGSCIKQIKGILTQSWPFTCISVSPQTLDYGQIRRGDSKTIQLTFVSKVKTVLTISPSEQWITIFPSRTIAIEADTPTVVDFKINASSLPAASKLSANVIIETNLNYCDKISIPLTVMTEDSITIKLQVNSKNATINDQERTLDVPAQIVAGRTMVPLRFISESFGCSIEWDAKTQKISIIRYDITVNLWIGKDFVDVNGSRIKIDSPPVIIGGRTMVPLRFIAEPFGAQVQWDAQTKGITIIWPKP